MTGNAKGSNDKIFAADSEKGPDEEEVREDEISPSKSLPNQTFTKKSTAAQDLSKIKDEGSKGERIVYLNDDLRNSQ